MEKTQSRSSASFVMLLLDLVFLASSLPCIRTYLNFIVISFSINIRNTGKPSLHSLIVEVRFRLNDRLKLVTTQSFHELISFKQLQ